jgi:hypothetical protein
MLLVPGCQGSEFTVKSPTILADQIQSTGNNSKKHVSGSDTKKETNCSMQSGNKREIELSVLQQAEYTSSREKKEGACLNLLKHYMCCQSN